MTRDVERVERVCRALGDARLDALVCALPANVLLLSGYWPVVGTSLAVALADGRVLLVIPPDEREFAEQGWADEIRAFDPGGLDLLRPAAEAATEALAGLLGTLGVPLQRVGYERGPEFEPASYASMHLYGGAMAEVLARAAAALVPAEALLAGLRAVKTPREVRRVRAACAIAGIAFHEGAAGLRAHLSEARAAAVFQGALGAHGAAREGVSRAGGFAFCMSGPNSAEAYRAYARTGTRDLAPGDLALVHCNSYADGYWTDITRTYCIEEPDDRKRVIYDAVFAAREAALRAVRPGVEARDVDEAARRVLTERGFGSEFRHGTGHEVGFGAINHNAPPRLHPASDDVLETGMVFNVEPAIYLEGYGGVRQCDVVAVTDDGFELLTPFQERIEELIVVG